MKKLLLLSTSLLCCAVALSQEVGRVVSSTPIIEQVGQPRNVCSTQQIAVQQPKSGAGALMGAIAGGAMGNAVGGGSGKAAATMIGLMGGAILGDSIEGAPMSQVQNVQSCNTQTFYENRVVAYNVVYQYAGKQYSVQMPNDPGPTVQLHISPVGAIDQRFPAANTPAYQQQPVYSQPITLISSQPGYSTYHARPAYYPRVYVPPVRLNFDFGYVGRRGDRGEHRHWR